jgi:hypothetical protein
LQGAAATCATQQGEGLIGGIGLAYIASNEPALHRGTPEG